MRGIPKRNAQHKIELDIEIAPSHQSRNRMNPNYTSVVKEDIDKLLAAGFVDLVDNATWLSPILVVLKKNGKLRICVDLRKLNAATKKDPYPIPFTDSMILFIISSAFCGRLDKRSIFSFVVVFTVLDNHTTISTLKFII